MYGRKSWGGDIEPFISTRFEKQTPGGDADPIVSVVIFEWKEEGFVGRYPTPESLEVGSSSRPDVYGWNVWLIQLSAMTKENMDMR